MRCYNHYDREAVSTCQDCGKAMCPECTERYARPMCDNCVIENVKSNRMLLVRNSVIMIVLFVLGLSQGGGLVGGLFFAGVPWGWSALNRITPNIFLFMPVMGWVIYFVIKLTISMIIGIFTLPYQLYKIINGIKESKRLLEYAKGA